MRTKALADDSELEFEFFLAAELGTTVQRLRGELGQDEFIYWAMYYARKAQQQELRQ